MSDNALGGLLLLVGMYAIVYFTLGPYVFVGIIIISLIASMVKRS